MEQQQIIEAINKKYKSLGENPDTYLKGLLQAKPINYWDYVQVDTLLSLQKPRTDVADGYPRNIQYTAVFFQQVSAFLYLALFSSKKAVQSGVPWKVELYCHVFS